VRKFKFYMQETGRITKDGFLVVNSEKTSRQMLNQADCLDQLRTIIYNSLDDVQQTRYKQTAARRKMCNKYQWHPVV